MLTLPPDLTPDEQATVDALRARAVEGADRDGALAIRVRRRVRALRRRMSYMAALDFVAGEDWFPYQPATARRIVERKGRWEGV